MKKFMSIVALLFTVVSFSQLIEPKYEIQNDLIKATYYYDNGKVMQEGFYKDGKVHGKWTSYTVEGKESAIGQYELGKKVGIWFFKQEGVIAQVDYNDNSLVKFKKK
ncbi:toxin-antitoxin system YwqK family antitoxin [Flavobacterium oreochromis]|uniref:Membrane-binding protein n=2 Tax=Flavobacterium TaxID=237 RepID=A0A246GDG5_9FLAO|nr:membrane-binding protein [Flavobacterium oreochromis]OWP77231.1 membrane-binding protein [Flavobacterium oreochromis]OWP78111.1 membrane-binding protein [Flavobacterium oreochromis]QYS87424.1 membrane-binding protein [Flavobacterium oreochromis]